MTMRAVLGTGYGGPEVLAVAEREVPELPPGHILVQMAAAGVNYMDIYQREGRPPYRAALPYVPGGEGAGTVTAMAGDVTLFAVGDLVAWAGVGASYAEQVVVPADRAVPVPPGMEAETAAAVMLQGMTAHYLASSTYPVQPGDVAVVHAAAGGVGLLLTRLIARRGGLVVATTSTPEKAELARRAGAHRAAGYEELGAAVAGLAGGTGAHVVYDSVGQATFDASLAALRPRGTMVLYGAASGPVPPFDLQRLNTGGSLYITRPTLGHYIASRDELLWRSGEIFDLVASGELEVRIGGRYPLADAARAQADLASRRIAGKLLLVP